MVYPVSLNIIPTLRILILAIQIGGGALLLSPLPAPTSTWVTMRPTFGPDNVVNRHTGPGSVSDYERRLTFLRADEGPEQCVYKDISGHNAQNARPRIRFW